MHAVQEHALTKTLAASAGQLQLNVMEPVITFALFTSIHTMENAVDSLRENCVQGITANAERTRQMVLNSLGIVTVLKVPDRTGQLGDVVLGFDNLDAYLKGHPYFGALIGRYGNRIAKGAFKLNGVDYTLAVNNGANHLHGGLK
jgi:hypothetical protein